MQPDLGKSLNLQPYFCKCVLYYLTVYTSTVIKCKSNFLYNPSKELLDNIFNKKKLFSKYKKVKKKEEKKKKTK